MKLLSQNKKLEKTSKNSKWQMYGLNLSPSNLEGSGFNTCKFATSCKLCCLNKSGLNVMTAAKKARIEKTRLFFNHRKQFLDQLHKEVGRLYDRFGENLLIRYNVLSDLPLEDIDSSLFTNYPHATFLDYSKYFQRAWDYKNKKTWPRNYHITYSLNEKSDLRKVNKFLKSGGNICVVSSLRYKYDNLLPIPKQIKILRSVHNTRDFDLNDIRLPEHDGQGNVGIVRAKTAKKDIPKFVKSGFMVDLSDKKWCI